MAYKPELWAEAKKKCRLNEEDIRMAKEMGLNPKSLIKYPQSQGAVETASENLDS